MTLSHIHPRMSRFARAEHSPRHKEACAFSLFALFGLLLAVPTFAAEPKAVPARRGGEPLMAPMAVQWKYTGNFFAYNPSTPIVSDDVIYFTTGNRVYAVNAQTGSLKWRYPVETNLTTFIQSSPTLNNGSLYFGSGDGLYALNAADGKLRWHYALRSGVNTSPKVVGDAVYFSAENAKFYSVNTETGEGAKNTWNRGNRPGLEVGDLVADFALSGNMMYYLTSNQMLHSVDITTAVQKWGLRLDVMTANSNPIVSGESLFIAAANTLTSMRTANSAKRWMVQLPTDTLTPPAVDGDGNSYLVLADRTIYSLDARGRPRWKQRPHIDYEAIVAPIVADGLVIVGATQGGVYAFDAANGAQKWSYVVQPSGTSATAIPSSTNVATHPVAVGDSLYVLTDDGALTAFRHGATDSLPPMVTILEPQIGDQLNGRPPFHISAKITDEGSGLNLDTLTVLLDNTKLARRLPETVLSNKDGFIYNPDDGTIEYDTLESEASRSSALSDGNHSVTIIVKDWMGNTATKTWTFSIDDMIPRRSRKNSTTNGGTGRLGGGTGRGTGGGSGGSGGKGGG